MQEDTTEKVTGPMDKMYSIAYRVFMGEAGRWFIYCREEGKFYVYEEGIWRQVFDVEVMSIICNAMPQVLKFNLASRKQILENLKIIVHRPLSIFNEKGWLNFKEGLFDPIAQKLIDHDRIQYSTTRIPYSYDPKASCSLWQKSLNEIFEGKKDRIDILQEFFGYCLTREVNQKKALLLLGDSNSGKSTILFLLRDMLGIHNCSSVPLKYMGNPQYTPMMINKLVNIDADVAKDAQNYEADFKIITSGEPVNVNQKFIAAFEFVPYCKIVLAANEFPRISDHSSAFYKRLLVIPCERIFEEEEQNKNLRFELAVELPGIFNWAVIGLQRLYARGMFEQRDFMKEALAELREESNPVEIFFRECIKVDVSGSAEIEKGDMYNKYSEWCKRNGNAPMAMNKFGATVYRKYSKYTPKNTSNHATQKRVWKNLRFLGSLELPEEKKEEIQWQDA